jgi:hypothetical protein
MSVKDIDLGWSKILADMKNLDAKSVKVGIQSGSTAEDGSNLAMIAAVHEYGNEKGTIPSRPFIRSALDTNKQQIKSLSDEMAGKIIDGTSSLRQALDTIGIAVTGMIQQNIIEGNFVPNTKETIRRKGSSRPLIHWGRMRQSIRHVVE